MVELKFEVHKPDLGQMSSYLKDQESKANERNNKSESFITWWDFPAGLSVLRILPPWDPTGRVALPVFSHNIEFQGEGLKYKRYNWTCQNATFGKPCKICDGLAEIASHGIDTGDWGPWKKKFYFNALVIHDPIYHKMVVEQGKDPKDVPGVAPGTHVLVKSPKTIYDWMIAQITNPMIGDISDIQNGIDIYVTKEGSGLGTKYSPTLSPNGRQPIPSEYLTELKALHNPDDIFGEGYDDKLTDALVEHLKKTTGVLSSGAIQNTHAAMGGYQNPGVPTAPSAPGIPGAGFAGGAPTPPPAVPTPPVPAPPVPTAPPAPPVAPPPPPPVAAPQEHIDAAGNVYHLIDNEWKLVKMAAPTPPPVNMSVGATPVAPPVPSAPVAVAPPVPVAPPAPVAPPMPQAPSVNVAPPADAPPSAPADSTEKKPICFGQHNPADINCVVCPFESSCALVSNGSGDPFAGI